MSRGLLFLLATPFVHSFQERPGRILGSIAFRLGGLLFFAGLLSNVENCHGDVQYIVAQPPCPRQTVTVMLAPFFATLIDSFALGWKYDALAPSPALWVAPTGRGVAMGGTW